MFVNAVGEVSGLCELVFVSAVARLVASVRLWSRQVVNIAIK